MKRDLFKLIIAATIFLFSVAGNKNKDKSKKNISGNSENNKGIKEIGKKNILNDFLLELNEEEDFTKVEKTMENLPNRNKKEKYNTNRFLKDVRDIFSEDGKADLINRKIKEEKLDLGENLNKDSFERNTDKLVEGIKFERKRLREYKPLEDLIELNDEESENHLDYNFSLQNAVIASEILDKPVSLRD